MTVWTSLPNNALTSFSIYRLLWRATISSKLELNALNCSFFLSFSLPLRPLTMAALSPEDPEMRLDVTAELDFVLIWSRRWMEISFHPSMYRVAAFLRHWSSLEECGAMPRYMPRSVEERTARSRMATLLARKQPWTDLVRWTERDLASRVERRASTMSTR